MLRGFYTSGGSDEWEVVVLDFDLSWHRGAAEKSITIRSETGIALGYLAPEQITEIRGVSTRNTAVDSFGLGMTLYFLFTGQHPIANASTQAEWPKRLRDAMRSRFQPPWQSLPVRMARLIERATHPEQQRCLDMAQIQFELERLRDALRSPQDVKSAELWAEEILALAFPQVMYEWNVDRLCGNVSLVSGVQTEIRGDEVGDKVILTATRAWMAEQDWRRVDKYFPTAKNKGESVLRKSGWRITSAGVSARTARIVAEMDLRTMRLDGARAAASVKDAATELSFD